MNTPGENDPCRVLQVTEAAGGGVRQHLKRLIPLLCRAGIQPDILIASRRAEAQLDDDLAAFAALGCRATAVRTAATCTAMVRGFAQFRRCLHDWQPHVIHLHAARAGLLGRLPLSGTPTLPRIYSPHGLGPRNATCWSAHRLQWRVESWLRRRTAALVCVSQAEAEQAHDQLKWPPDTIRVIENGLEPEFADKLMPREAVRAEWGLSQDRVVIGVPGRLAAQKDPATVLDALSALTQSPTPIAVLFCGDGPLRESLEREARRRGLSDIVFWMGQIADLARRMRGFDAVILASRYEGLSYALLESLAAGVPVIAADIEANVPRKRLRQTIACFSPGNPEALAQTIRQVLDNLNQRSEKAAQLAPYVITEFSAQDQAANLTALYRDLARRVPLRDH